MLTNLKAIRLARGENQGQVAGRLEMSLPWYSLLENGRLVPSAAVKERLEKEFNKPISELLASISVGDIIKNNAEAM